MTDERFDISRRKALAALGTIGVASAGAGLGTSAYFSDQETFQNNSLTAGTLDLVAATSTHYVDWLPDTPGGPEGDQETDDATMPENEGDADLVLGAGNIPGAQPIELDISNVAGLASGSLISTINNGVDAASDNLCEDEDVGDADGPVIVELDDVKPGDFGIIRFAFASCDNPAFVWCNGNLTDSGEGETPEPELDDPDEADGDGEAPEDVVELLDQIQVATVPGDVAALISDPDNLPLEVPGGTSLRNLFNDGNGKEMALNGDIPAEEGGGMGRNCFSGETTHYYTLLWWLPIDHGNEVQGDFAEFTIGLYAEQCRHNDGVLNNEGVDPDQIDDDAENDGT